jgi:hypothetical protein
MRRFSLGLPLLYLSVGLATANATSIVEFAGINRIILAADTRLDRLDPGDAYGQHYHDDGCKIAPIGSLAIAVGGIGDYTRLQKTDSVADWNSLSDAKISYSENHGDLRLVATGWALRAAQHYKAFFAADPERVKALAAVNNENVLVDAFITGWASDTPTLIWEKVYFEAGQIQTSEQVLPSRLLPYTTNGATYELIEGGTPRTTSSQDAWRSYVIGLKPEERDWRFAEFLIRRTGMYDDSVSPTVNVVQIPEQGDASWLQNLTCH